MSIALSNGKKKGNVTRFLSPKSNSESSFAGYLYFWFLVTILPQAMLISRTDGGNLVLKLALYGSFVFLSFIKIVSSRASISSQRVLSCIILFCILLAATGLANQQELSIDAMTSLITIFTNYAILMVFFGNAKLTYSGLSKVARLYQAFILYACVFNVIKNGHAFALVFSATHAHEYAFSSFFGNRNTFALFLYIGVVLTVLHSRINGKNLGDNLFGLIIAVNLFFTLSRTSIFGTILFLTNLHLITYRYSILRHSIKLVACGVAVVWILMLSPAYSFVMNIVLRPTSGTTGRTAIWAEIIDLYLRGNLILGRGLDIIHEYYTHNTYLSILVVGGLSLVIVFGFLYLSHLRTLARIWAKDEKLGPVFLAAFLSYMAITLFELVMPFASSAKDTIFTLVIFVMPHYFYNFIKCQNNAGVSRYRHNQTTVHLS